METVLVYMVLFWNNPTSKEFSEVGKNVVVAGRYYRTEEECWAAMKASLSMFLDPHVACVKTMISSSEKARLDRELAERNNKSP